MRCPSCLHLMLIGLICLSGCEAGEADGVEAEMAPPDAHPEPDMDPADLGFLAGGSELEGCVDGEAPHTCPWSVGEMQMLGRWTPDGPLPRIHSMRLVDDTLYLLSDERLIALDVSTRINPQPRAELALNGATRLLGVHDHADGRVLLITEQQQLATVEITGEEAPQLLARWHPDSAEDRPITGGHLHVTTMGFDGHQVLLAGLHPLTDEPLFGVLDVTAPARPHLISMTPVVGAHAIREVLAFGGWAWLIESSEIAINAHPVDARTPQAPVFYDSQIAIRTSETTPNVPFIVRPHARQATLARTPVSSEGPATEVHLVDLTTLPELTRVDSWHTSGALSAQATEPCGTSLLTATINDDTGDGLEPIPPEEFQVRLSIYLPRQTNNSWGNSLSLRGDRITHLATDGQWIYALRGDGLEIISMTCPF